VLSAHCFRTMADPSQWWHSTVPFFAGGVAGCLATFCVLPADYIKVQKQLSPKLSAFALTASIVRSNPLVLWSGLGAAWARQFIYTSARIGLYSKFSSAMRAEGGSLPFSMKLLSAAGAGGLSALISTPFDLVLTRTQAENGKPPELRKKLGGPLTVLANIFKNEGGVSAVWRGATPTVLRAVVLNMGMLAVGDQLNEVFKPHLDVFPALILSSLLAGLCSAVVSLPADLLKTRLQSQSAAAPLYTGIWDCATRTLQKEGLKTFWSGLVPYCSRIAPHAVITLIAAPYLTAALLR
jgi:solute carrier family 25 oxoglutarate transporter 11